MIPGMDIGKLKKMMKDVENIDADRVIIEGKTRLVIEKPQVMRMNLMGQETFQIIGKAKEVAEREMPFCEEDVTMVMEQTEKDEETVKEALIRNQGDIAKTILELK
jgi:nascent polypeptide-associated complex subunit alpha